MTLPNFVGVGTMKSGTSWLNNVLATHPQIYIPRREIHYFDRYLERGRSWYESNFPTGDKARSYRLIGEFTPSYMAYDHAASDIAALMPDAKIIVSLRNPVDRTYSEYTGYLKTHRTSMSFDQFIAEHPKAVTRSLYHDQTRRLLDFFPRDRMLFLCFERFVKDRRGLLDALGRFLGVPEEGFDLDRARSTNSSYRPRYPALFSALVGVQRALEHRGIHGLLPLAHRLGVRRIFAPKDGARDPGARLPALPHERRQQLHETFAADIAKLESLLKESFPEWRPMGA
jgi:hypothetical protein